MLPHASILLGNMMLFLFVLEQINPSMNFIDNGLTKGLLVVMALVCTLIWRDWDRYEKRRAKARAKKAGRSAT